MREKRWLKKKKGGYGLFAGEGEGRRREEEEGKREKKKRGIKERSVQDSKESSVAAGSRRCCPPPQSNPLSLHYYYKYLFIYWIYWIYWIIYLPWWWWISLWLRLCVYSVLCTGRTVRRVPPPKRMANPLRILVGPSGLGPPSGIQGIFYSGYGVFYCH